MTKSQLKHPFYVAQFRGEIITHYVLRLKVLGRRYTLCGKTYPLAGMYGFSGKVTCEDCLKARVEYDKKTGHPQWFGLTRTGK